MALLLHIETSGPVCSVSLARDGETVSARISATLNDHMTVLSTEISTLCSDAGVSLQQLDAIAISAGPGSYTGLRIGVSTAKGICHAINKPLIAVNTLKAMIEGVKQRYAGKDYLYCPLIDARRMEVYMMVGNSNNETITDQQAYIIEEPAFNWIPSDKPCVFFGSGVQKCIELLPQNALIVADYTMVSTHMHKLAFYQYNASDFANMPYFEPIYGKEFYTSAKKQQ